MSDVNVTEIRSQYPVGTKIEMINMLDEQYPIAPGTKGSVAHVDDLGTIHVHWENGSTLGMIPGLDKFKVIEDGALAAAPRKPAP